ETAKDLLVVGLDVQVAYLQLCQFRSVSGVSGVGMVGDRGTLVDQAALPTAARRPPDAEKSTSSASVVPARALVTPPWTRVHSSFVEQAWSPSLSWEQRPFPSGASWKHSIGAICPSRASTTRSMVISSAGFASR